MEQVWWYATRAAGLMTWSAAVASVLVGLALSTRVIRSRTGPWVLDLHRFIGGLTVAFLLVHLVALWADSYVEFSWQELLVPGESQWRPRAVAWGVVSAWILLAVEVTSILRKHIGQTLWRVVHWMSLLVVAGGTVHALEAGSDVENPLSWAAAGVGALALIALAVIRLRRSARPEPSRRPTTETEVVHEMRQRLDDLPVPATQSRPEYVDEATSPLPRRPHQDDRDAALPGGGALLDALGRAARSAEPSPEAIMAETLADAPDVVPPDDTPPPDPPLADSVAAEPTPDPPFTAEPVPTSSEPDLPMRQVGESTFATTADQRAPLSPRPFVDPDIERQPGAASLDRPPDRTPDLTTSPFATPMETHESSAPAAHEPAPPVGFETAPPTFEPAVPEFQPAAPPAEPVAPAGRDPASRPPAAHAPAPTPSATPEPAGPCDRPVNPFSDVEPPTISLTSHMPVPAPVAPALPENAVDPSTGEPDEEAYRQWLVEWLAFAEQYGDEATSDPSRS